MNRTGSNRGVFNVLNSVGAKKERRFVEGTRERPENGHRQSTFQDEAVIGDGLGVCELQPEQAL